MRVNRSPARLAVATLWLLACSPDPTPEEIPPPSGAPEIYRIIPNLCHDKCWHLILYRTDTFIELRAQQGGDALGQATGSLSKSASEELDQLLEEPIDVGELSASELIDSPIVQLSLSGLRLLYDEGYPPTGLVELDAFLAEVLYDMSQCRPTTQITPDHDCEPLNWFPE